jgi:hypothetical protein
MSDAPTLGRPPRSDAIDAIKYIIDENPFPSQERTVQWLTGIERTVKQELALGKIDFPWIPHELIADQKAARVTISPQLLAFLGHGLA